jgi:hypothetical protein
MTLLQGLRNKPTHRLVLLFALVPILWAGAFVATYGVNLTFYDSLIHSLSIVAKVRSGTFQPQDILMPYVGHVTAFSNLITVLLVYLTDWNMWYGIWLGFGLAVGAYMMSLLLMRRSHPHALILFIIPLGVLLFNTKQTIIASYAMSVWMGALLQLTLMQWLVFRASQRLWHWVVALLIGFVATFTVASGFVMLWLLLPAMWFNGNRRWWQYVLTIVYALAVMALYISVAGVQFGDVGTQNSVDVGAIFGAIPFTLAFLGGLWTGITPFGIWLGGLGIVLLLVNGLYLLRFTNYRRATWLWAILASYPIITGALIGLTRQDTYIGYLQAAVQVQYKTVVAFFWISVAALMSIAVWETWNRRGRHQMVTWINVGATVLGSVLFVTEGFSGPYLDVRYLREDCHRRFVLLQDREALFRDTNCLLTDQPELVNVLAYYDLNMFAQMETRSILPENAPPAAPVVVMSHTGWENYHIQRWLLAGVEHPIAVYEEPPKAFPQYGVELVLEPAAQDTDALVAQLSDHDTFFTVHLDNLDNTLLPIDFIEEYVTVAASHRVEGLGFQVTRYDRLELTEGNPILFDDNIQLTSYTSLDERLRACETVTIRSFWETPDGGLLDGYSVTATLDRITGDGLWDFNTEARSDSQLTLTPTNDWQPGQLYLDERTLELPCDLPDGEYILRLGVYNYRDEVRLTPIAAGQSFHPELNMADVERVSLP